MARWGRRGDRTGTDQAPIVYFFKETTAYTYDYRNRLTEVTQGGTVIATYTYDPLDRRIGIDDSGTQTWTVYDGHGADDHPYADFNGSGTLLNRYIWGPGVGVAPSQILARISSGGTFSWYLNDRLGTVRDITGSTGTVLDHVVYDSFGNVTSETNAANGDRFKYAGMEYDATVGQYYDRARYYDPALGRFMELDSIGFKAGDSNLYRYVRNDVGSMVDPSGHVLIPGAIGGALFGLTYSVYQYGTGRWGAYDAVVFTFECMLVGALGGFAIGYGVSYFSWYLGLTVNPAFLLYQELMGGVGAAAWMTTWL